VVQLLLVAAGACFVLYWIKWLVWIIWHFKLYVYIFFVILAFIYKGFFAVVAGLTTVIAIIICFWWFILQAAFYALVIIFLGFVVRRVHPDTFLYTAARIVLGKQASLN
jgi:hypothetical protein